MLLNRTLLTSGLMVVLTLVSQSSVQAGGHHGGGGHKMGNSGGNFSMNRGQFQSNLNSGFRPQTFNQPSKPIVQAHNVGQKFGNHVISSSQPMKHIMNGNTVIHHQGMPQVISNRPLGIQHGSNFSGKNLGMTPAAGGQKLNFIGQHGHSKMQGFPNPSSAGHWNKPGHSAPFHTANFPTQTKFYQASKSFGPVVPFKYCGTSPWKYCGGYGNGCWGYGGYGCHFGGWGYPTYYCGYQNSNCGYFGNYGYGNCLYTPGCYGGIQATILQPSVTTAYQCQYSNIPVSYGNVPVSVAPPLYSTVTTSPDISGEISPILAQITDELPPLPPLSDVVPSESFDLPPAPSATPAGLTGAGIEQARLARVTKD